ncbi:hypothetical protein GGF42_009413, partial [Coemansia sp. RSA 2424]
AESSTSSPTCAQRLRAAAWRISAFSCLVIRRPTTATCTSLFQCGFSRASRRWKSRRWLRITGKLMTLKWIQPALCTGYSAAIKRALPAATAISWISLTGGMSR